MLLWRSGRRGAAADAELCGTCIGARWMPPYPRKGGCQDVQLRRAPPRIACGRSAIPRKQSFGSPVDSVGSQCFSS
jgi:hypothetical protein